jgi:hypothetical protein
VHLHAEVIGHCDDGTCGCKFSHWHVRVVIVDAADLAKALSDKMGLIVHDVACHILLCLKDPL